MVIKEGAPWMDVRVRRAMNLAINRNAITKNVMMGFAKPVAIIQGPASFGYNPELKPYPHDPAQAKKLLAEAGHPKGFSFDVYIPRGRFMMGKEALEGIAGQWAQVGPPGERPRDGMGGDEEDHLQQVQEKRKAVPLLSGADEHRLQRRAHVRRRDQQPVGLWRIPRQGRGRDGSTTRAPPWTTRRGRRNTRISPASLRHEKVPIVPLYQTFRIFGANKKIDWRPRADGKLIAAEVGTK